MAIKIITTVGTSIFSNYQDKDNVTRKYPTLSKDYDAINTQCKTLENLSASERNNSTYTSDIEHIKDAINYLWLPEAKLNSCAEIQTLAAIAKEATSKIDVILLATDTVLSVVACELIKEWLQENTMGEREIKCTFNDNLTAPDTTIVKGLQIKDAHKFTNEGFQNLLAIIKKHTVKDKNSEENNVFLNISGGYKALIPYLTLLAQLEEIPLKYMYEDSDQLITVGNLPFSFDWAKAERYYLLLADGKEYFTNNQHLNDDEAKILIEECETMGLISGKTITELGKIFISYVSDKLAVSKNSLGFFMEYKLIEYFQYYDKIGKKAKITHSIEIEAYPEDATNLPLGNEIDILIETVEPPAIYNELILGGTRKSALPTPNGYITIEVKPLMGTKIEQFKAFLNRLNTIWSNNLPEEIRLIVYSFLPIEFAKKKFQQDVQIKEHADLVKNIFPNIPFTAQLVNVDIAFRKSEIRDSLMKKSLKPHHFVASKTFINGSLKS